MADLRLTTPPTPQKEFEALLGGDGGKDVTAR